MPENAIVIGGGFGGIAAALRLRKRGYAVTLIDKQDKLGGRAYVYHRNGFVFDAGPTVITAPFLIDELFELFGKNREDYVKLVPLYPWYRIQFADGIRFNYGGTLEQTLDEIRKIEPADADGYLKLLAHARKIFDVGFTQLGDKPFSTIWSMVKVAPQLISLGTWRSVWQMTCKYIKNEKLRRVFSFQPLLIGGNPFATTSIYSLIQHLEREWGVHFAMGGTGAIVAALQKLMREAGIKILLDTEVSRILLDARSSEDRVNAVRIRDGDKLSADIVVCNADAPFVYKRLLDDALQSGRGAQSRLNRLKYSMGLFVLYFGTRKKYDEVVHHTILLGQRYRELLKEMFDDHKLEIKDFSLYLHRPTATDPSMAPRGCDAFYVLCPVPNLQGQIDWKITGPQYRELILDYLELMLLPDLRKHIVEDFYVTPEHFRDNLNTLHGTGFSIQPTFRQSAYGRFHNKSDIAGLYFVGAGTHPGAGLPGVLCSAKVLENVL